MTQDVARRPHLSRIPCGKLARLLHGNDLDHGVCAGQPAGRNGGHGSDWASEAERDWGEDMGTRMMASVVGFAMAGCAMPIQAPDVDEGTTVLFRSEHGRDVTVAVGCGDLQQNVLGVVESGGVGEFEIPNEVLRCVWGLRFWLIPENHPRGYMTDPIAVRNGDQVDFWIEKYPAQSAWRTR